MSLNVGELVATMRLDDAAFRRSIQQAPGEVRQGLAGAEREGEQAGERTGSAFGAGVGKMIKAASALAAGIGLVDFFMKAKDAASDLNETVSKAGTIFGQNYGKVEAWSKTAATSLGLSQSAALAAAAGFGDMFLQLGIAEDKATDMSTAVVQMAADFGSFNNLDTATVLDMISGAMKGEYDSIQAVLPNISAARVEHEALALSGKSVASELTAADKAMAVMAIAAQDGSRAMGDYARTADSTANTEKTLAAQWEETAAAVGQKLLPAWNAFLAVLGTAVGLIVPIADAIEGLVKWVIDLPGPLIVAAAALAGWALFGTIATAVTTFAASVGAAALAVKGFMASLGPIGLLIVGVGTAFSFLMDEAENTEAVIEANADRWERFKGTLDASTGAVTNATRALVAQEAQTSGLLGQMTELGVSTEAFVDASTGAAGGAEALAASVGAAADAALDGSAAYAAIEGTLRAAGVSQEEYIAAVQSGDLSGVEAKVIAYGESVARSTGNVSAGTAIQEGFQSAVSETSGPLSALAGFLAIAGADADDFAGAAKGAAEVTTAVGEGAEEATPPMENLAAATDELKGATTDADTATQFLIASLNAMNGGAVSAQQAADLAASAMRGVAQSMRDREAAQDAVTQANLDLTAAEAELASAQENLNSSNAEVATTSDDVTAAQLAVSEAHRNVSEAADGVTAAEEDMRSSHLKARDAAIANATSAFTLAGGFNNVDAASAAATAKVEEARQAFINTQPQADILSGKANATADALFGIPGKVATDIRENGAANVQSQANNTTGAINAIPDFSSTAIAATGVTRSYFDGITASIFAIPTQRTFTLINETINRTVNTITGGLVNIGHRGGALAGLRGGGTPDYGAHTNDGQLALVHRGEHMLDSMDVARLGGQSAVYGLRDALSSGGPEAMAMSILSRYGGGSRAMAPAGVSSPAQSSSGARVIEFTGPLNVGRFDDAAQLVNHAAYMGL